MTLTEFLLARIAEDEATAQACVDDGPYWLGDRQGIVQGSDAGFATTSAYFVQTRRPLANLHIALHDPARVLAEVAAKRRIVGYNLTCEEWKDRRVDDHFRGELLASTCMLYHLASVYSDHPDFDPAWRV